VQRLGEVSGVRALGVELNFAGATLACAAAAANRSNEVTMGESTHLVRVTKIDRERVLARARRCAAVLEGRRILWIDDHVGNNVKERSLLEAFRVSVDQAQDNESAFRVLDRSDLAYDLIVSDIGRGEGEPTGLDFLAKYRRRADTVPTIFYVGRIEADRPLPVGAFGLTNRPDELLHRVIDALERSC
jgi:CheY-like chemotaxis protein